VTIPLVEWPGSVIRFGIEALVKAVVFYYFTVAFVDSEARLKKFIAVFVGCQLFRVIEPLYLHVTEGYWGSIASMANWEYLNRLSGAPSDIVNPNGLAFIICTVLPFLWFAAGLSWIYRMIFLIFAPLCVYALMLTGSRTGLVGLIIVTLGILAKAKRRFELAIGCALIAVLAFPFLSDDMQDRYLSLVGLGAKNEATFEGRITGVITNFEVALRRPVFGHGLGTSLEANANFGGIDKPAHNLYAEAAIELGFIGMVIFIFLIVSIFEGFRHCRRAYINQQPGTFLWRVVDAMQVWLLLNIAFSFASYGVTSYEWYLLGGLAVVLQRLVVGAATASNDAVDRDSALHVAREPSMLPEKQRGQTL
jgi:O-antigen ligase